MSDVGGSEPLRSFAFTAAAAGLLACGPVEAGPAFAAAGDYYLVGRTKTDLSFLDLKSHQKKGEVASGLMTLIELNPETLRAAVPHDLVKAMRRAHRQGLLPVPRSD